MKGIYSAASGMIGQWLKLQAISNNISNVNTTGYKRDVIHFKSLLAANGTQPQPAQSGGRIQLVSAQTSTPSPFSPLQNHQPIGNYAIDFSGGELTNTGNPLDFALKGDGFFVVSTPEGRRYTRSGSFTQSTDGELQTHDGFTVLGKNGPITIGEGVVKVSSSGEISVDEKIAGTFDIVDVQDRSALVKEGNSLFYSPNAQELGTNAEVLQGHLELSNVKPVNQMVELINTYRSFQIYQKTMQTFDENFGRLIDIAGR